MSTTGALTQAQVLTRASNKKGGTGAKQDRDVALLIKDHTTSFAGYVFIKSLGTPLTAILQTTLDIIRFKNYNLMLIAVTSCKVPRGILFVDASDTFNIRAQNYHALMLKGDREDVKDEVNYKALRLVGYSLCVLANSKSNSFAKAYLEDNGNPLSVDAISVPADSLDEALLINAQLQKTLPLSQRTEHMNSLNAQADVVKTLVDKTFNAAPALHDHFMAVLMKQTDIVAFMDKDQAVYGVKPTDASARKDYEKKGVFNKTDAADETKHVKPSMVTKNMASPPAAQKALDLADLGQEVLRLA
jgi:hypothetical protein